MRYLITLMMCLLFFLKTANGQDTNHDFVDGHFFSGTIPLHNKNILHLITGHPSGFITSWNRKTFGEKDWQQRYNYPDWGITFNYQDLKNQYLGHNYGLYAHFNFYFFRRNLMFRIGQGLAYASNPYDKTDNFRNVAFGSDILSTTLAMINYKKERLIGKIGFSAGASFIHYSNANVQAPNTSVNTLAFNIGLNYNFTSEDPDYLYTLTKEKFTEPVRFNLVFRTGINESDIVDSGQFPFYIFSAYADKRLSHVSAVQFGAEVFFSKFLEELILYESVAFEGRTDIKGNEDYRRVGIFVGHELFINKLSLVTQLGYYVYYPFDFEGRTYIRVGLKYYVYKKWFASVTLKSHGARAEAVEFGIGIRL
jgi:hypothetical protein